MILKHFQTIGKKQTQEDAFYISSDRRLFVVCDGVGGRRNGELASKSIVKNICALYESDPLEKKDISHIKQYITQSIQNLNELSHVQNELNGISTTLALFFVDHDHCFTAHIGDSRVIILRRSTGEPWSTKDHSVVQELFDAGLLKSEREMRKHPYRNRITKAIVAGETNVETISFQKTPEIMFGDCIVICSDGLLEQFTNEDLQKVFDSCEVTDMYDKLKESCDQNSKDNTTVILFQP